MFRQRTSAAKPGDELLATFREQFPHLSSTGEPSASSAVAVTNIAAPAHPGALVAPQDRQCALGLSAAPQSAGYYFARRRLCQVAEIAPAAVISQAISHEAFRDQDPTPRASGNELFKFTPSLMDPNSFSFANFANAPPGYYTPTPGGTNTLYHPQAGDLHTPSLGLGMGIGTPLSMPTTEAAHMHSTTAMIDMGGYHHGIHPPHPQQHQFHPQAQFHHPFIQPPQPQQSFAPSTFVHQDTGYETMDQDGSPMESDAAEDRMVAIDSTFPPQGGMVGFQPRQFMPLNVGLPASAEKFRFHSTLNAPTAMIKHADEIPVTYLNKGQAYSLSIVDTTPTIPIQPGTRFRTFVRVSFEDEQQRQKPGVCWSLWKEGRGTNEAHQRGGKLQAVEYVEAGQPAEGDDKRTRIELETSSFDGFSVIWTPGIHGAAECTIAVRFNFLSTDFSHSKGVKGIPVRLCAKTSALPFDNSQASPDPAATEICYCKVKLFRDHGAERKLANDVQHVKKTIDKLKQQITQAESGMKDFNKRKRSSGAHNRGQDAQRPGKVQKHKRTWSMSSTSSAGAQRPPLEEDLHFKLQTLQDMFTSTRPVSILYLRGEDLDDPDLHPVALPGDSLELAKAESREGSAWQARGSGRSSVAGSSLVSPSPSSLSLQSQASVANAQWQDFDETAPAARQGSDQPVKVNKTDDTGSLTGWIEALGVDASYKPPPERSTKPVACFYILRRNPGNPDAKEFHRAIYLMQRNLKEFVSRVAAKWGIESTSVVRVVHALDRGLEVEMDDDVISELPEGQDMILEITDLANVTSVKREWEMSVDDHSDNDAVSTRTATKSGYEFRLTF
ncbi:uncharacterized protein PgNI_08426 [Pyricularia grisea]|uniref:Grh/CP2 DB domain-containing protein n=1 Tax=Pyricularia grisea TaxID=148305 RepID=A0A6P8AWL5_PYRGI|nr:uncharacterized protein PgNI_08426 [Pyricularia grisea]TLD06626.1 hypothetical protein PgNI_08426 [Pyricularia grisea]